MIGWSIAAAIKSGVFARIIVSTDDAEIASIARDEGAETPFHRPPALSDDHTPTVPVIAHAVQVLDLAPGTPVCCLYATAPMVQAEDVSHGLTLLTPDTTYVVSVTRYPFPIQRALRCAPDFAIAMIDPSQMTTLSQDLEEAWHDAGQFYWAHARTWTAGKPVFGPGARGVPLPRHRVQDIDTPDDWRMAEALFALLKT